MSRQGWTNQLDPVFEKALAEEGFLGIYRNGPNIKGRNPLGRLESGTGT